MRAADADVLVSNVSDTARWVACYRAIKSARPDAIFKDPLAERLAGEKGKAIAARAAKNMHNGWPVIARTKVIDDLILASVAVGCDCVVNLAAGLDTRLIAWTCLRRCTGSRSTSPASSTRRPRSSHPKRRVACLSA